ncbi:MAG: peptide chain release factor N(5)-glutamine methyltransferase [Candidatus Uhrbacteria bacterium]
MASVGSLLDKYPKIPIAERELLLAHCMGTDRAWLLAHPDAPVSLFSAIKFFRLSRHVAHGMPLAYVIGEQWFCSQPFIVQPGVLIPRPETEQLVELAGSLLDRYLPQVRCIDVGTGSGCIAISLALAHPTAQITAIDTSRTALRVAKKNARRHNVLRRIKFCRGNLLTQYRFFMTEPTIICANLPYLTSEECAELPCSIRDHEPRIALDGGEDGLDPYRAIFAQLATVVDTMCIALFEIDPRRERALRKLVQQELPSWDMDFHYDLAGRCRILEIRS